MAACKPYGPRDLSLFRCMIPIVTYEQLIYPERMRCSSYHSRITFTIIKSIELLKKLSRVVRFHFFEVSSSYSICVVSDILSKDPTCLCVAIIRFQFIPCFLVRIFLYFFRKLFLILRADSQRLAFVSPPRYCLFCMLFPHGLIPQIGHTTY